MTTNFPSHNVETAPEAAKPKLAGALQNLGFIPEMYAKQAEAPVLLEAYGAISGAFEQSSFNSTEQFIVYMAASYSNRCDFCLTAHSWLARNQKKEEAIITALRDNTPIANKKLEALRQFVAALTLNRGHISDSEKEAFFAAGYNTQHALEVIVGIAAKVMTNYTNSLAGAPPNPEFGDQNIWVAK